ncbi:hypothetical protein [Chryseobacterium foetidum]|uniref:hypothetical protein n=1 Tax=Chryseobacterium foetidum TaxID=2951057 RepID=UPI0021C89E92|nr:hypothetical protein [Chryseobacterium foetidum]
MKKIIYTLVLSAIPSMFFSQVVMTDKATPAIDNSAVLKLDSDNKGVLYPRIPLDSNLDVTNVPAPLDGTVVFNTKSTVSLPQTVAYYDTGKWNALLTKDQLAAKLDLVNVSSITSPGNIAITGYSPGNFSIGDNVSASWVPLQIEDSKTFTRSTNSFAFTLEGMAQLDKASNSYFEYAIGIFVDNKLAVVRKYHKHNENFTCSWHKFVLNGVVNNLSVGTHTISVRARNIASSSSSSAQKIIYGGVAQNSNAGNPPCDNMSNFMSKISLSTTIVESIN